MFRSRWFRNTLLTLFILLLVVGIVLVSGSFRIRGRGEQHQARVLADLDAKDPGWRFEQIQAARQATLPPAEKNVIQQAMRLADRFPELEYRQWTGKLPTGERSDDERLAHSRQLVELCRDLIPEARELRHLSGVVFVPLSENPVATRFPHLDKAGRVLLLLEHDASASAADGRIDDTLLDVLAVLALARGLEDEPYLISCMFRARFLTVAVRAMERALQSGEASDARLAEVQAALEAAAKVPTFVTALRGERASMSKLADLIAKDPEQADGLIDGKRPPKVVTAVAASTLLPETHARFLELMTRAIEIAQKPPGPERNAEFAQIDADVKADTSLEGEALRLVFPAIVRCYDTDVRTAALLQTAVAAVACWRQPALVELPTDPFTGKPLVFKKSDDGFAVYSTGPDGKDDGGENLTVGGTRAGSDWGVRLYDGKKR